MPSPNTLGLPDLGVGLAVGADLYSFILDARPEVDWIEVVPEHALEGRGRAMCELEQIAERYPIALHGLSLSIGSADSLDVDYIRELAWLADRTRAVWISDHLCWTGVDGVRSQVLLPLPYNDETLAHLVDRVRRTQDLLDRPLLIENPAAYLAFASSTIPEHEFLARLAEAASCGLLVDLGNLQVSRHSGSVAATAAAYLDALPPGRVVELHLSGYTELETHSLATPGAPLSDDSWELLARARDCFGERAVALDRADAGVEPSQLIAEVRRARDILQAAARAGSQP